MPLSEKPSMTKNKKTPKPVKVREPKPETIPAENKRAPKPANNPEAREQQLVRLAVDLAEKQLIEGTASPSIINHYLKIASSRDTLEREILEKQARLIEAKALNLNKDREAEELAKAAIEAMKNYNSKS